jgi:hypothetical protein
MKAGALLIPVLAGLSWGQPALDGPLIGFVQDKSDGVRFVFGIAGNFSLGDTIGKETVSSGFSGSLGLLKTDRTVSIFDQDGRVSARLDAPAGPALFAFADSGENALIYLVSEGALLDWSGGKLTHVPIDQATIEGEVVSLAQPSPGYASMLVRRLDGIWFLRVSLTSGAVGPQRRIPAACLPALLLNDGALIFSDSSGITLRRADATEIHFDLRLSGRGQMRQMGAGWVQIENPGGGQFAMLLTKGRERIYQLPEARP